MLNFGEEKRPRSSDSPQFYLSLQQIMAMSNEQRISTNKAPKPVGLYPHARKVGELLFLSGVGPRIAGSNATDSEVPGLELDKNGNFLEGPPLIYGND